MATTDRIEINPAIMQGKPVIRGTRVPVELILRKLGEGAKENDLLDADPMRLNALLQGVGYAIICDDKKIIVNESSFDSTSTTQEFRYSHVNRATNSYIFFHGETEMRCFVPNALQDERNAQELAELALLPTKHFVFKDGELHEEP